MAKLCPVAPSLQPIDNVRRAVLIGLIAALIFALSATTIQFKLTRECKGVFSSAFSSGFDRRRCQIVLRHTITDFRIAIPLS
jgi:hypothetical protein